MNTNVIAGLGTDPGFAATEGFYQDVTLYRLRLGNPGRHNLGFGSVHERVVNCHIDRIGIVNINLVLGLSLKFGLGVVFGFDFNA